MSHPGHPCPRCGEELEQFSLLGIDVFRCPRACGLTVAQNRLMPLTQALAKDSLACIDPALPIEIAPDHPNESAPCPGCSKPMQTFGYLESRFAYLDRCNACAVVWIDHAELETVVRLAARNLGQLKKYEADRRELARHLGAVAWASGSRSLLDRIP